MILIHHGPTLSDGFSPRALQRYEQNALVIEQHAVVCAAFAATVGIHSSPGGKEIKKPKNKGEGLAAFVNSLAASNPNAVLVLIKQGLEPLDDGWLAQLCAQCQRKEIGLATLKVVDGANNIVSAGWSINAHGQARANGAGESATTIREFGRYLLSFNCDFACRDLLAVQACDLLAAGGLAADEEPLCADAQLALRLHALGRRHCVDGWLQVADRTSGEHKTPARWTLPPSSAAHRLWQQHASDQRFWHDNYISR